jgi:hypothetical protein
MPAKETYDISKENYYISKETYYISKETTSIVGWYCRIAQPTPPHTDERESKLIWGVLVKLPMTPQTLKVTLQKTKNTHAHRFGAMSQRTRAQWKAQKLEQDLNNLYDLILVHLVTILVWLMLPALAKESVYPDKQGDDKCEVSQRPRT